jgi:hypothetical protein
LLSNLPLDDLVPIVVDALVGKQAGSAYAAVDNLLMLLTAVSHVVSENEHLLIAHNLRNIADSIEQMKHNLPQTRH